MFAIASLAFPSTRSNLTIPPHFLVYDLFSCPPMQELLTNDREYLLVVDEPSPTEARLDAWISQQLPVLSRARIQKLIAQGQVLIDDRTCEEKKFKLKLGMKIKVVVPPDTSLDLEPEAIELDILYEDEEIIIINKPAGMVVHPAAGHARGTLVHALLAHSTLSSIGGVQRPGIVHRLDKDTSGAMVVAKTDFAHHHLQAQLQAKTARREYLGVVYGSPTTAGGTIDLPIGRHPKDRQKNAIVPPEKGGRNAVTHWEIAERLGNYSLLRYRLETGRTHQIRVHSQQIGHPIVGDPVYGSGRSIGVKLLGQALHAERLQLIHPRSQQLITATAPLPPHLVTLLQVLRRKVI
jgi:23S rRNA pseudouridine1911/1915/1917 synthase